MAKSEVDQSSFFNQLKGYGISRILKSPDFVVSLITFIVLLQDYLSKSGNFAMLDNDAATGIITITATIFAIIIAAVAIILSFSGTKFAEFLRGNKKLHKILFNFWLCSVTHLTVIVVAFTRFLVEFEHPYWMSSIYSAFVISGFVYAILQTFYSVSSIMRFAHFLEFYESVHKNE